MVGGVLREIAKVDTRFARGCRKGRFQAANVEAHLAFTRREFFGFVFEHNPIPRVVIHNASDLRVVQDPLLQISGDDGVVPEVKMNVGNVEMVAVLTLFRHKIDVVYLTYGVFKHIRHRVLSDIGKHVRDEETDVLNGRRHL